MTVPVPFILRVGCWIEGHPAPVAYLTLGGEIAVKPCEQCEADARADAVADLRQKIRHYVDGPLDQESS